MDTKEKVGQRKAAGKAATKRATGPRNPRREEKDSANPLQDVVYVPPKPFMRKRLFLRLATIAAIVLSLVLAMAVFFRVDRVEVSGVSQYTAWQIREASGIKEGDSLFSLELTAAAARIKALDYVKDVRIGVRLPNTVVIEITEVNVTYSLEDQNGAWWMVESGGKVIDKVTAETESKCTKILGVQLLNPEKGSQAGAFENTEPELDENGNPIPVTVTAAKRLSLALNIAQLLEANGVIGEAASIDVSDLGDLQFWYGEQYQVKLGNEEQLSYKISMIKGAINQLSGESHNSGVLEVFLNEPENTSDDEVKYTRFQ